VTPADCELVRKSQHGDRAAFEELVRRSAWAVFTRLYLETADSHKAEDLAQETFLTAWRSLRSLTDPQSFRPWLFAIAHSVLLDSVRHESRKKRSARAGQLDALDGLPSREPPPSESADLREQRQNLLTALRCLPEEYRLPLIMRYLGGADYETIGRELALTNGSLRGLLSRGLAILREKLNDKKSTETT
jgi:RNA polymerase sigma-70 factor (ECF subfamily)